jgi:hypothetical protein
MCDNLESLVRPTLTLEICRSEAMGLLLHEKHINAIQNYKFITRESIYGHVLGGNNPTTI